MNNECIAIMRDKLISYISCYRMNTVIEFAKEYWFIFYSECFETNWANTTKENIVLMLVEDFEIQIYENGLYWKDFVDEIKGILCTLSIESKYKENFIRHTSNFTKVLSGMKIEFETNEKDKENSTFITKTQIINNNNNNTKKGESRMKQIMNQFMPEYATKGDFALTMNGKIAIKRSNGDYVRYNAATKEIENQMDLVFGEESIAQMVILMPTKVADLKTGDVIKHNKAFFYVEFANPDGSIKAINLTTGNTGAMAAETNVLTGCTMYKKVFSMFDTMNGSGVMGNGFNPMMLMLMDKEGDNKNDMLKMFAMSQMCNANSGSNGFNPMMFMLMDDKSGSNDMLKMFAMSSMMSGGNMFSNNE